MVAARAGGNTNASIKITNIDSDVLRSEILNAIFVFDPALYDIWYKSMDLVV